MHLARTQRVQRAGAPLASCPLTIQPMFPRVSLCRAPQDLAELFSSSPARRADTLAMLRDQPVFSAQLALFALRAPRSLFTAHQELFLWLVLSTTAHFVQRAPLRPCQALRRVNCAPAATIAFLALLPGHLIAAKATFVPTALALPPPAPSKCLLMEDGALCKFKAPHSWWRQLAAPTSASGTLRRAMAC
jgi:hypothetical protein